MAREKIYLATVIDFQLCGGKVISKEVDDEIRRLWGDRNFGNDYYYDRYDSVTEFEDVCSETDQKYPAIIAYLKSKNIEGPILLHWWW